MLLEKTISQYTTLDNAKWGDCPLCHKDDVLLVKKKRWHCYNCGLGGDVIDFLVNKKGVTTKEAIGEVKELKKKLVKGKKRKVKKAKKGE